MPDVTEIELKRYLKEFGFLRSPNVERFGFAARKAFVQDEDNVEAGLMAFQSHYHLPVTGELDEATTKFIKPEGKWRPRCGFPDVGQFVLMGNKWPKNELTFAINSVPRTMSPQEFEAAILAGFKLWTDICGLKFTKAPIASADIVISTFIGDHGDGNPFDGAMGVLAHAFYPTNYGGTLMGDVHFDGMETWVVNTGGIHAGTVFTHEIGHSIGLAHSNEPGAMMYAYYSGPRMYLHQDDKDGGKALYGPPIVVTPTPTPTPTPNPPPTPPPTPPTPPAPPPSTKVYATKYGKYFHKITSHWWYKQDRVFDNREQAIAAGLKPCWICKP